MSGYYSGNDECESDNEDEDRVIQKKRKIIAAKSNKKPNEYTSSGAAFSSNSNLWFLSHRIAKSDLEWDIKNSISKITKILSLLSVSTSTDNITSVSRQHYGMYRRRKRQFHRNRRQPSRASSLSSMTETSMALDVTTVTVKTICPNDFFRNNSDL